MFILPDPVPCERCGQPAIGCQILGCCAATVCRDHADPILTAMKPGEKKEWGVCYYVRF